MAGSESISEESVTAEVSPDALDPLVGITLDGRFRIVERIGHGAMGKVYRAMQVPLNRPVALKILDSRYGAGRDESFRQRFLVEAALTAKLSHPNTVRVLDYGTSDGLFYLAMEYLDGQTLEAVLQQGAMPWRRVLGVGQQIARALKEAHQLGVVHRDLKPANVVLLNADDDTDHVKVLDFGLVKSFVDGQELEGRAITQQGMLMGSPPYMAPEQGERNRADPRSDIYSLGVLLFEGLTGRVPFGGLSPIEIILKHVHEPVPSIVTPAGLEPIPQAMCTVVEKCLAKSPMDRFQSMDEVLQALQEISAPIHTPTTELPASDPAIPMAPLEAVVPARGRLGLMLGFLVAMAAGIGGTALVMRSRAAPVAEAPVATEPAPPAAEAPGSVTPAAPSTVLIHVDSEPAGAQVILEGRVLGLTPLDLEQPVDGQGPIELTLSRALYADKVVTLTPTGRRMEVNQKLTLAPPRVEKLAAEPAPAEPRERRVDRRTPAESRVRTPAPEKKGESTNAVDSAFDGKPAHRKGTLAAEAKKPAVAAPPPERPASKLDEEDDVAPVTPPPTLPSELKRPPSFHPSK